MPRSKEISEDIRRKVVEAHESGKGYKLISKAIGLPKTTIRAILRKWKRFGTVVTLPRSGRPSKISPRARREIIREVMKNPCTTSKDLQATLASSNICVHQSTIRRILGIHGRPTLSSFEGSMALQSSSREEDGMLDASDGSNQDVKNEEEQQVLENSNTNSDSKDNAKSSDNNNKESGRHDKSCGDGEKTSTNDIKDEENGDKMQSEDGNGAGGGDVETTSTNHAGCEHGDGGGERETCNDGGDGTKTISTNPNSGGGDDHHVETVIVDSNPIGDVSYGIRHDAGYATGRDVNSAYSSSNSSNNSNNNNNNNGGNWGEEMDYISTLTFS